jgi:hypothetical protein
MNIIPDKRRLVTLVEQGVEGKLCLPNFQRDFVWNREEIADLMRSTLRRYFIGSLLLLRTDPRDPPFSPLALRGAKPTHTTLAPELLVLDGQQRLTSLLYALTAPILSLKDSKQRRWFYVDLKVLRDDPESDGIVIDRSPRDVDGLNEDRKQWAMRILPCTRLLRSSDFLHWRDGLDDFLRDTSAVEHEEFRSRDRDIWTEAVSGFQNFEVPLVELPMISDAEPESIGRVCAIFEKLNSTGVDLSVYDLLTARLYRSGIRLHDLWTEACHNHPRLKSWSRGKADTNKFGVLVLRTLALLRQLDPKPRILIDLKPEGFTEDWRRAASAIDRALALLENVGSDGFGVFEPKWLPGFGVIPILAALRAEIDERHLGDKERGDLRRWYWCSVFLERYSSAVESKSKKDYTELRAHWLEGGPEPAVFGEARAIIGSAGYTIRDSASYASAIYSGVFTLLALGGARDWKFAESIQLQTLDDHHIFPKQYLLRHGVSRKGDINTIVNRTLISGRTNRLIKDKAPASYAIDPSVFPGGSANATLLNAHFITGDAQSAMLAATEELEPEVCRALYDAFLSSRERTIVDVIRRACGVVTA